MITGKRILVTGGAGSIGSELVRQLAPHNQIFILDINESEGFKLVGALDPHWVKFRIGDIRDKETVHDVFSDFKPQVVFHAAALKHVSPAQQYPQEYVSTNINGTLNLIEEAKKWESTEKFVFISTDKAVHPTNVMGATKMCAEVIVKSMGYTAVRFGNVLASRGSVLEIWADQVKRKIPITITHGKMKRYFMSIPDAVELVIEAAEQGEGGQVWVMDMGEQKYILQLKDELYPNYPHEIIGIRDGESLEEMLLTSEEEKRAVKKGKFYVI